MSKLPIKRAPIIDYADRPTSRGIATATSMGLARLTKALCGSRLLNLIENDTGTALLWDYSKTDRRFALTTGGQIPRSMAIRGTGPQ